MIPKKQAEEIKVLRLTLKKKWFDMIISGEKTEEYREIKDYWKTRLYKHTEQGPIPKFAWDMVTFRNGYHKAAREATFTFEGLVVREGKPEWGAEKGVEYYVIKLGEKLPF